MTGNYPPGMSKRDFIRAGIDDPPHAPGDHNCKYYLEPVDRDTYPLFEDAAARYMEYCTYAKVINSWTDSGRDEVYEETGPACGNEYTFDHDIQTITHQAAGWRLSVSRSPRYCTALENRMVEDVMVAIRNDEHEVVEIDPHPDGETIVRVPEQKLRVRFADE